MYSTNAIRIYSLVITIVITFCVRQCSMKIYKVSHNVKEQRVVQEEFTTKDVEEIKEETEIESVGQEKEEIHEIQNNKEIWQLMIPKIDLIAPIEEGTDQNTIKKSIGHFMRNWYLGRKCRTCST